MLAPTSNRQLTEDDTRRQDLMRISGLRGIKTKLEGQSAWDMLGKGQSACMGHAGEGSKCMAATPATVLGGSGRAWCVDRSMQGRGLASGDLGSWSNLEHYIGYPLPGPRCRTRSTDAMQNSQENRKVVMHEASQKVLRLRLLSTMLGSAYLHAFVPVFRKHVSGSTNKAVSLIV